MASYRNPYNSPQGKAIDSISQSLGTIFAPSADTQLYQMRAANYMDRAEKLREEARLKRLEVEAERQKQADINFLRNSPVLGQGAANLYGLGEAQSPLAQALLGTLLRNDPNVAGNLLADAAMQSLPAGQRNDLARRQVFARGQQPSNTFAINDAAADAANQRAIAKAIAIAEGRLPSQMARDDNRMGNQMILQDDRQNFQTRENQLDRDLSRETRDVRDETTRRGQDIASEDRRRGQDITSEDRRRGQDMTSQTADLNRQDKVTARSEKNKTITSQQQQDLDVFIDELAPYDVDNNAYTFTTYNNSFAGDSDLDERIAFYMIDRVTADYKAARADGEAHLDALKFARQGLTRQEVKKEVEFEIKNSRNTYLPRYIVTDLKDIVKTAPNKQQGAQEVLQVLMNLGFKQEKAEVMAAEISK